MSAQTILVVDLLVLVYVSKDVPFGIFSEHTVTIPNGSDFGGRKETVLLVSL
jgi:hypothetical protein